MFVNATQRGRTTGYSGMKAALNDDVPQHPRRLVVEACIEGVTGWSAPTVLGASDPQMPIEALYGRLQNAYCLATTGGWRNDGGVGATAIDDERVHRQHRLLFQQHCMVRRYATAVVSSISGRTAASKRQERRKR
jgi:hypothetical protein